MGYWRQIQALDKRTFRWGLALAFAYLVFSVLPLPAITPFLKFGMFSDPVGRPDTIAVVKIYVNGNLLSPSRLSIMKWDQLTGPLTQRINELDPIYQQIGSKNRFLQKAGLNEQTIPDSLIRNSIDENAFLDWNAANLERLLQVRIDSFRVTRHGYTMDRLLIPVSEEKTIWSYARHP
ncbi:hypothetical protein KJS94_03550 [Flavihumibacter rivuli]|uniref:hypothetical protein n=1 Tax=Flavihumibacter rivuli TaxID=2838156 RepID=UPI001BDDF358|nr:hypothetical protein [Flavihumibacter rivuli]ULQ57274.1 hypothetical protein KJS94_03550 [Flavihumibacter rivuli]